MTVISSGTSSPGIALLGYGAIAGMHASALRDLGARIEVVAGPNSDELQAFAARHEIERWTVNVDQALELVSVGAVVIASPSQLHPEQVRAAIDAGHDVLCEIPLALSAADAESLVTQAAANKRVLMVCHTLRYYEPFEVAHVAMKQAELEPISVVARFLWLRHSNIGWTGRRRSWTDNLLWHHGGHVVDAVLGLLDASEADVTSVVGRVWEGSRLPMDYGIVLRVPSGAVATISLSYSARIAVDDYLVIGDQDMIEIAGPRVRNSQGPIFDGQDMASVLARGVLEQDRDFIGATTSRAAPRADARTVLPAMRILQQVHDHAVAQTFDKPAS